MLSKGEKVFVITRRLFEGDLRRHFIGEVQDIASVVVKMQGYSFVFDESTKQFVRQAELRTRIFSLIDTGLVIHIIPREIRLDDIQYRWDEKNRRILTDGKSFQLNINEFSLDR